MFLFVQKFLLKQNFWFLPKAFRSQSFTFFSALESIAVAINDTDLTYLSIRQVSDFLLSLRLWLTFIAFNHYPEYFPPLSCLPPHHLSSEFSYHAHFRLKLKWLMVQKFQLRIDKIWTHRNFMRMRIQNVKNSLLLAAFSLLCWAPVFYSLFLCLTWAGIFSDCELSPPVHHSNPTVFRRSGAQLFFSQYFV